MDYLYTKKNLYLSIFFDAINLKFITFCMIYFILGIDIIKENPNKKGISIYKIFIYFLFMLVVFILSFITNYYLGFILSKWLCKFIIISVILIYLIKLIFLERLLWVCQIVLDIFTKYINFNQSR